MPMASTLPASATIAGAGEARRDGRGGAGLAAAADSPAGEDTRQRGHCRWAGPGGLGRTADDRSAKSPARQGQPALPGGLQTFRDLGSARQGTWWYARSRAPSPSVAGQRRGARFAGGSPQATACSSLGASQAMLGHARRGGRQQNRSSQPGAPGTRPGAKSHGSSGGFAASTILQALAVGRRCSPTNSRWRAIALGERTLPVAPPREDRPDAAGGGVVGPRAEAQWGLERQHRSTAACSLPRRSGRAGLGILSAPRGPRRGPGGGHRGPGGAAACGRPRRLRCPGSAGDCTGHETPRFRAGPGNSPGCRTPRPATGRPGRSRRSMSGQGVGASLACGAAPGARGRKPTSDSAGPARHAHRRAAPALTAFRPRFASGVAACSRPGRLEKTPPAYPCGLR